MHRCFAASLFCLLIFAGCGAPAEPPAADRDGLERAVADHLNRRHMELKIDAWKSYAPSENGLTATAELAMTHAGGMVAATARFIFHFEKKDGTWRVTTHEQK